MERYLRNQSTISIENQKLLKQKTVVVVGCGGLGGHVIEQCARLGIGRIICYDSDVFDTSNLNRQRFSTEDVIGKSKAEIVKEELNRINSEIEVISYSKRLDLDCMDEVKDAHCIVDAVDRISTRLMLQQLAKQLNVPLVSASIAGWYGQCTVVYPHDDTLSKIYPSDVEQGIETELGNPSFTPALLASIETAEVTKVLLNIPSDLRHQLLVVNLLHHEYTLIRL